MGQHSVCSLRMCHQPCRKLISATWPFPKLLYCSCVAGVNRMTLLAVVMLQLLRCSRNSNTPVKLMFWEARVSLPNSVELGLLLLALG